MARPAPPRAKEDKARKDGSRKPAPPRMTERRLNNIATFYLQRFTTTAQQLRQVLTRRADRSLKAEGSATRSEILGWIDALVMRLVESGAVNDTAYAEGRTARMRRLGKGSGKIRAALMAKGITADEAKRVVAETATRPDGTSADLAAAIAYVQRRRLGAFRKTPRDRDTDRRDLGALARAGFSLDVAREALKVAGEDA